ncbi:MAG: hypothetical protein FJ012_11000 [Chloroflexi bacterium]|nr:hypothetical protein [Chloroflexota bacterium]
MPKIGFIHFDENGVVREETVEVTREQLGCECILPARFLGGTCDRFYTCKYAAKVNCKAGPSKLAENILADMREKQAAGEEIEGEEREDMICQMCEEPIDPGDDGYGIYYGDEGTDYEGKPLCETCYYENEPCATVYFGGEDAEPCFISSCRNETEGAFTVQWHSTDPWRGYYELKSDKYTEVFTDAILSGHESEEMLKKLYDMVMERFEEEEIDFARAFCRSSNLFMTSLEIWVRKDLVQLLKAYIIIANAKEAVDYDNDLYKTGILISRDALERFKSLMGQKYEVHTDADLMHVVEECGQDFVPEIVEAIGREGKE